MKRSYKTAEIAFAGRDFRIIRDKRLRECDYGDLTGHSDYEIKAEKFNRISVPYPGGESYEQAMARMKEFLDILVKEYNGKRVMVIGHRATQYGLEYWINGVPLPEVVTAPWQWQPGWKYVLKGTT